MSLDLKKLWKKNRKPEESLRAFALRLLKTEPAVVQAWFKGKKDARKTSIRKPRISKRVGKLLEPGKKKGKKGAEDKK